MAPGLCIETYLQQQDAGPLTGGGRLVVPDRRLHLTDMCLAEQQHGQARLADAPPPIVGGSWPASSIL